MKYTPHKIKEDNLYYTIPIYQRLFEWNEENIEILLKDLKREFDQTKGDYYIGMLTSTKDNELVDGQQRFTVMMLLGCVLQDYYSEWKEFLVVDDRVRLDFTSRSSDRADLRSLIAKDTHHAFQNLKMGSACSTIRNFMESVKNVDEMDMTKDEKESFAKYIFNHLSFFVSYLPEKYSPRELNKYFERMNTTGKNLEQHEILKVKLLSCLGENIDKYMMLWNKIADVDTLLIRRRENEDMKQTKCQAITATIVDIFSGNIISGFDKDTTENAISIAGIKPSESAPKNEREINKDSKCALSFPYLLLQVLYRKLDKQINGKIDDFFKPNNLLTTFEEYLPYSGSRVKQEEIKDFMERLLKARLALDICFIRPTEYGYSLDLNLDDDSNECKKLMMLQSMIYVSSSNYTHYKWFNWLMDEVEHGIPDGTSFYTSLISAINHEFSLPSYEELAYGGDNRYWFWKLDFYIWLHREELFEKDSPELNIAENYIFKRNRSIEHVAPQKPQSDSTMQWEDTKEEDKSLRDSFGNLVMISQGLNSTLWNSSFEIKKAHVESYCHGSKSGSIESLKLLMIYKDYPNGWDKDSIAEHGQKMYESLKKSMNQINDSDSV